MRRNIRQEQSKANTPKFEASADFEERFFTTLKDAGQHSGRPGFAVLKAERLRRDVQHELKFDADGQRQLIKLLVEPGTNGYVSAGGWVTEPSILPDEIEGFCDNILIVTKGAALSILSPLVGEESFVPGGFEYIVPVFGEEGQPLIHFC